MRTCLCRINGDVDGRNLERARGRAGRWTVALAIGDSAVTCRLLAIATTPAAGRRLRADTFRGSARWLYGFVAVVAGSALLVSFAHALSRSGRPHGGIPFWIGVALPVALATYRQTSPTLPRLERVAILVVVGLFLYAVKVIRDPFMFTFADEFILGRNVAAILETHRLFTLNPLLPATSDYPGLASVIAALSTLSDLSIFGAGLAVLGVARMLMMLATYFLFERLTQSPQAAALGSLAYISAPNFLFFTAQANYESLALPMVVVAAATVAICVENQSDRRRPWALAASLTIAAVVVTHHMSSYALIALLLAWWAVHLILRHEWETSPSPFAILALALAVTWLVIVSSRTVGYLQPVFLNAVRSALATVAREGSGTRHPFASHDGGPAVPLWDRGLALASTALIVLLVPVGVRVVLRRHRDRPLVLVLAIAAVGYVGTLALRLVPAAWEIATRASEFLFVGVGLVVGLACSAWVGDRAPFGRRIVVALVAMTTFAGGAAAGWPAEIRLAQSLRVRVDDEVIEPQGVTAARFVANTIPTDPMHQFAATPAESRLLLLFGTPDLATGGIAGIENAITLPLLEPWQRALLRERSVEYVLIDRRAIAADTLAGYFFATRRSPEAWSRTIAPAIYGKFDRVPTSRIFDSGDIVIYDIGRLR